MKKSIKYLFAALALTGFTATSCSDFGDVNIDPEHMNEGNMDYRLVFTQAQHQALGSDWDVWRNGCIYTGQFMQHLVSLDNGWYAYSNYDWSDGYASAYWDDVYYGGRGAVRDIITVMNQWRNTAGMENDYQMARIVRAYLFHRLTDLYGDIPYTEAGQPDLTGYPKYDTQESIYKDLLKELDEAQAALPSSGTASMAAHDIYYGGDLAKWKKFANSLMLRVAMRLTKVDENLAKEYVAKAVANGVITSNADNAMLQHPGGTSTDDSAEPYAKIFSHEDYTFFLGATFVNMLKNTNDPRLALVACVCENPEYKCDDERYETGNADPSIQQGLPSGGYTIVSNSPCFIGKDYPEFQQYADNGDIRDYESRYSVPNRLTYGDQESPTMIVTNAETKLLMAEAVLRGYISGDAKTLYEEGVRAAMEQFSAYEKASRLYQQYITDAAINEYLTNNPFDATNRDKALEQINTQYYITTFCDEYEAYANWRRSGYPVLKEEWNNGYTGKNQRGSDRIPRRFTYPSNESQTNAANYREAVGRLSQGDDFDSRMWWDVQ